MPLYLSDLSPIFKKRMPMNNSGVINKIVFKFILKGSKKGI